MSSELLEVTDNHLLEKMGNQVLAFLFPLESGMRGDAEQVVGLDPVAPCLI